MLFNFKNALYRNVLISLTHQCNLACDYCYIGSNKCQAHKILDLANIEKLIVSYLDFIKYYKNDKDKYLYLIWHGGEPLLAGERFFEDIISIQKKYQSQGIRIINGIETNATLINEKWAIFFKKNEFCLGVSLDGTRVANDIHRKLATGNTSFNKTISGIRILKEFEIPFSIISVVTDLNWKHIIDSLDFITDINPVYVDFLPCYEPNGKIWLSASNYEAFLNIIFEKWIRKYYGRLRIRFLDDLIAKISNNIDPYTPIGCEWMGRCGEIQYVDLDRNLYPCVCLPKTSDVSLGDLVKEGLLGCLQSENYKNFKDNFNKISDDCEKCDVFKICKGGCAARRFYPPAGINNNNGKDFYCHNRRSIIKKVLKYVVDEKNIYAKEAQNGG